MKHIEPGLELDLLIAEKVMGHKVVSNISGAKIPQTYYTLDEPVYYDFSGDMQLQNPIPNYSTDIARAWEVVDKLAEEGIRLELNPTDTGWAVSFLKYEPSQEFTPWTGIGHSYTQSMFVPHAICLAALKVKT